MNQAQFEQMKSGNGFIGALDQSGGSTAKALGLYGVTENAYSSEAEMFDLIHAMRSRIIKSASFTSDRVIGVILFEMTMNRTIDGLGTAEFLWQKKNIVPFLKIDNGLADEVNGAQVMKPIPELSARLAAANSHGVFGTKMRSVIKRANSEGVSAVVKQQFEIGKEIIAAGLVSPRKVGDLEMYSPLDREILEIISKFAELGIDVRNLKRWKQSAESEVSLYEGRIKPFFMQKNPSSKAQAEEMLDDLIELGEQLRSTLVEVAARSFRGNR